MSEERLQEIKDSVNAQYEIIGDNEYYKEAKVLTDEEQELVEEIERLHSIIKEVREYIETNKENTTQTLRFDENKSYNTALLELLEILDKVGDEK